MNFSEGSLFLFIHRIKDRFLKPVLISPLTTPFLRIIDKKTLEKLGGVCDGWDSHPGPRPRKLAASVNATLRTYRQGRKSRLIAGLLGEKLIDSDISIFTILCL